jgi:DNA-binding beta-propeller fold protein YncE
MALDVATKKVTPVFATANGGHQVLAINHGKEVLETDGKTDLARFINADTGVLIAEIKTGKKPDAALIDPATGLLVVMNAGDGTVSLIDPEKHTLAGRIAVGGSLEFGVSDGKGLVYVNVEDKNEIAILDIRKRTVIGRIPLTGCDGPTGLAFVANGKRLVSSCANKVATITDPVAKRVVGKLVIAERPDTVLYDAKRGRAFIPCGEGYLMIIEAASAEAIRVVGRLATVAGARTGTLDPTTGMLYLPSAHFLPPVAPATRGVAEPGSFALLVIAPAK